MLYRFPDLDLEDVAVLEEVSAMRAELAEYLRVPRRWAGRLRRTALAAAIRGSNSIEGYRVELDDADAALDDEQPLSADVDQAGIDARTASRDFKALTGQGLLRAVGETKGRHYVRGDALEFVQAAMRRREPLRDPYRWMPARLVELTTP